MPHYDAPSPLMAKIVNPVLCFLIGTIGINIQGAWVLTVRGRKSGQLKSLPVNVLIYQGARYLVSPRGETQWVRNLRAAGDAQLRRGNSIDKVRVAEEVAVEGRPPILRAYMQKWDGQTKGILGFDRTVGDSELAEAAAKYPVFRLIPVV